MFCLRLIFLRLPGAVLLHTEYLVLLAEVLVFDDLFTGFGEFEFFEFLVEAPAILDDCDAGAANEFNEPIGFQGFDEAVCLFALAGGFEYGEVLADHYGAGAVFAEEPFHLYLFGDLIGGDLIEGQFLPDDLFVSVVVSFEDLHLFFQLTAEFAHYFLGLVDDDGKAVDTFYLRGGSIEAFDVYLTPGEQDGDAVDEADLVFRVDGYRIFLFLHEL